MVNHKSFDEAVLERLRFVPCTTAFAQLDGHLKRDNSFVPSKDPETQRWHCATPRGEFELLVNGPKWYDTRAKRGGGGAIDLTMKLYGVSFVVAVGMLLGHGL